MKSLVLSLVFVFGFAVLSPVMAQDAPAKAEKTEQSACCKKESDKKACCDKKEACTKDEKKDCKKECEKKDAEKK